MRLDIVFVSVCMVLIAGSAGAMTYVIGFGPAPAALIAVGVLAALGTSSMVSARFRARPAVNRSSNLRSTADLTRHDLARLDLARLDPAYQDPARLDSARHDAPRHELGRQELGRQEPGRQDVALQITQLERGFAALDRRITEAMERTRAATDPLADELGEINAMIRELAETLAVHERKLAEIERTEIEHAALLRSGIATEPPAAPAEPAPIPAPAAETPQAPLADAMAATIRSAIEANRVDLYLQPMVTLPQRKIRYYEALSRLRSDKGDVVLATDFLSSADAHRLMPQIDNLVVFRCVQVVRRLLMKNREIGLFCNLSGATLTDGSVFPQLLDFLEANRAIASSIVLEFPQSALRAAGPIEIESLAALADRGYRFSLDNVTDLRFEPRELATRGFRFVKVRADVLLRRVAAASDIDTADLSDLLGRFGIDLIAERIESEGAVVDLLDYGVKFGQGFVFSPPRPVRAEALQGIVERREAAREQAGAIEEAAPTAPPMTAPVTARPAASEASPARRASAMGQIARRI